MVKSLVASSTLVLLLFLLLQYNGANAFVAVPYKHVSRTNAKTVGYLPQQFEETLQRTKSIELYRVFRRSFSRRKPRTENKDKYTLQEEKNSKTKTATPTYNEADICIIGGGVSGLTAAITAAKAAKKDTRIVLLEAQDTLGGRVQTDKTDDGYLLDRGFAVFIEEYPASKELLDYDALKLGHFQPGALVKLKNRRRLAKVADPLRQPEDIVASVVEPVGSVLDKANLLPLIFNVKGKSIEQLFEESETDTEYALKNRWNLGDDIIEKFFRPFLEGIYLAPLNQQSSRMFHFIFKMFSDGAATLPAGGIGAVAEQLADKAAKAGVDLRTGIPVKNIKQTTNGDNDDNDGYDYIVEPASGQSIKAKTVIVATDGEIAQRFVAQIEGFQSLNDLPHQPQRKVGCLYYAFKGPAPVDEPILILNGIGPERGTESYPVNNCCFPSVVNKAYAPEGHHLCSVTILQDAVEFYEDREEVLDDVVRNQLATWFPDFREDILNKWELKAIYDIANAQPGQLDGPWPANVYGGRPSDVYRGKPLPKGLLVCGDHVATATLNGALESGKNAGLAASKLVKK